MAMRQKVTDHGYNELMKKWKVRKGVVEVGIFEDAGAKNNAPGLTVLEVMTFHEFGLGVPERSFMRGYVDENADKIRGMIRALTLQINQGKITRDQALDRLGLKIVGEIQKRISEGIPPPNAPSTIAKKGSSTPLIDTGQGRASITHKVRS